MRKEIGAALLAFFALTSFSQVARENYLPNIIINYADDPGYGDISCYESKSIIIQTGLTTIAYISKKATGDCVPCIFVAE